MPGLVGGFGNYFLPVHMGAPDMANKNLLNKLKSKHTVSSIESNLGAYLAGLYEGDGHISIFNKDSKHNPRFNITFNLKDKPLADRLLLLINFYA